MNKERNNQLTINREEFRKLDTKGKIMQVAQSFDTPAGKNEDLVLDAILRKADAMKPAKKIRT